MTKKIVKNTKGTYEMCWDESEQAWTVWELNADGQPFIFLGRFYYLESAEQKLKEEEMEYQKLIKSMLESNDPVLVNYAKTLI